MHPSSLEIFYFHQHLPYFLTHALNHISESEIRISFKCRAYDIWNHELRDSYHLTVISQKTYIILTYALQWSSFNILNFFNSQQFITVAFIWNSMWKQKFTMKIYIIIGDFILYAGIKKKYRKFYRGKSKDGNPFSFWFNLLGI